MIMQAARKIATSLLIFSPAKLCFLAVFCMFPLGFSIYVTDEYAASHVGAAALVYVLCACLCVFMFADTTHNIRK